MAHGELDRRSVLTLTDTEVHESPLAALLKSAASLALSSGATPDEVGDVLTAVLAWVRKQAPVGASVGSAGLIHSAADLAQIWSTESEFLDDRGVALALTLDEGEGSFPALVRREGSFATAAEALEVLIRHGVAESNGRVVKLLKRLVIADPGTPEGLARAWMSSVAHLNTLLRNVSNRPLAEKRPERTAVNLRFPIRSVPALKKLAEEHGQAFLELMDQVMREHEERGAKLGEPTQGVGVGFWQFDLPTLDGTSPANRLPRRP